MGKRQLPSDYLPDETAIICGRGKACTASPGNTRLKSIVQRHIEQYAQAKNKADKTKTVNSILEEVQQGGNDRGMFVRNHNGEWWEVEDSIAREKVGCMIRDILHMRYRSSSKAKFEKKKQKKSEMAIIEANAIYNAADQTPPRSAINRLADSSTTFPAFTSGGLFSMGTLSKGAHGGNFPISINNEQPRYLPDTKHREIPRSIDIHDSMLTGRVQRLGESGAKIASVDQSLRHSSKVALSKGAARSKKSKSNDDSLKLLAAQRNDSALNTDDSSPDSTSWGMGISRGYLQLAQSVVDGATDDLPDDISGIFD